MLAIRLFASIAKKARPGFRPMSSATSLVDLTVDSDGIATATMQRQPVNSLNLNLIQDLIKAIDEVEKNKWKGMILTSASPTVFSAGLDIMEMYKPDMKRAEAFWTSLQELWIKLFGSNFVTAAAINGHAPAGGCMLATSCEYRVMVNGKFTIGLNEANLGLVVYKWFINGMSHTISQRNTELAISRGTLFTPDEALKVGLIDETATDKTEAIEKCKQFIKKFDKVVPGARATTKLRIREAPLKWMQENRTKDLQEFLYYVNSASVQQTLEVYLQNMKQKKVKKI